MGHKAKSMEALRRGVKYYPNSHNVTSGRPIRAFCETKLQDWSLEIRHSLPVFLSAKLGPFLENDLWKPCGFGQLLREHFRIGIEEIPFPPRGLHVLFQARITETNKNK